MWEDLQERFPGQKILNTGFGGSQASDLLYYLEPLVLAYQPKKVFIYEGDNDLAEGKRVGQVLKVLEQITRRNPKARTRTFLSFSFRQNPVSVAGA